MQGDNYPYQLKKELSEPIPFDKMSDMSESKLYYHFESLTKQGYIEPIQIIKEENRPDKQIFTITQAGREVLPKKIYEIFEKATKLGDVILGLMFLQYVDVEKVMSITERKKQALEERKERISFVSEQIQAPQHLYANIQLANDYIMEMIEKELEWFDRAIVLLKSKSYDSQE